jgi:hypothetical protein
MRLRIITTMIKANKEPLDLVARHNSAGEFARGMLSTALINGITGQDGSYLADLLIVKVYHFGMGAAQHSYV